MNGTGVWVGLGESGFLARIQERERDPARLVVTLVGGVSLGLVASVCLLLLLTVVYALLTGQGSRGFTGLREILNSLGDEHAAGEGLEVLRLVLTTTVNAVFLIVMVAFAALVVRRPLEIYLTAAPAFRWRLLAVGMALAATTLAPVMLADRWLGGDGSSPPLIGVSPHLGGRVAYALAALLLIPAAAAEEMFFRGWLLRQTAILLRRPVMLIGVTAMIFSALHFEFAPDAFLTRAVLGASFAYMTLRLGGVELAIGAHAIYNMMIVLFLQPLGLEPPAPAAISAVSLAEDVALAGGYVLITEAIARLPALRRLSGVGVGELSPAAPVGARFG